MNKTSIINARIEPSIKKKAEKILSKLGITPTEAIRLFYNQIYLRKGLPFSVRLPNELTKKTIQDGLEGKNIQEFSSLDDVFQSWNE